jgi:hypothetical protein
VFGPKQAYEGIPVFVSLADLNSAEQLKRRIYIWGWVVYRDIFPGTPAHLSEVCLEVLNPQWTKPSHADPTGDLKINSLPCETHYCYDVDCTDYTKRTKDAK